MNAPPEPPDTLDPADQPHRRRGRQLLVIGAILAVLALTALLLAILHRQPAHTTTGSSAHPAATLSAAPTNTPGPVRTGPATTSKPAVSQRPATRRPTRTTTAGPVIVSTARTQNNGGVAGAARPQQAAGSAPAAPVSTPAPPRPTHAATPTPTPVFVAHFISAPEPAAFDGIPRGGAAQSAAETCARDGDCGVTGVQWGGSCSLPAYRGDTAGAAHSGWAIWQRGPADCTWAMAVSSY
jgi:hypothetical protein